MIQSMDWEQYTVKEIHPRKLAAKAQDVDTPDWDTTMNGPDQDCYWEAAKREIAISEAKNTWDIMDHQPWMNILPSTWAFRCKHFPNDSVHKLKGEFCIQGDCQLEGVNFFDTFAPVINWATVHLLLILSVTLGLTTMQVNYTAAFIQAPIDCDPQWVTMTPEEKERSGVFVEMPRGFSHPGKVLELKKSLYRLKQNLQNFFHYLKDNLE